MKKLLTTFSCLLLMSFSIIAQSTPSEKQSNFDKRFRFGIRATPQPTWFKSNNNNSVNDGINYGFGFGLVMEFKLSKVIHFSTGIGGDFEGGYIKYRNDNDFMVNAVLNNEGEYIESADGIFTEDVKLGNGNTQVILKDRRYKATMVSIPLILKMMTEEYNGFKYFALFGGELGIRAGIKADDNYAYAVKTTGTGASIQSIILNEPADLTKSNINVNKDGSFVPLRAGMNLGLGTEYRIGGSTSLLMSLNYFQAFTNLMRNDSKYLTKSTNIANSVTNNQLNQGYFMRAVRVNIALLF